jgi:hypothetical protein
MLIDNVYPVRRRPRYLRSGFGAYLYHRTLIGYNLNL